jgi:hypothetical protein
MNKFLSGLVLGIMVLLGVGATADWFGNSNGTTPSGTTGFPSNYLNARLLQSYIAPTISSGWGTGATIASANGTAAFQLNTGAAASSGVLAMPAATTGWACNGAIVSGVLTTQVVETASTTTTVSFQNIQSGVPVNLGANSLVNIACSAI